MKEWYKICPYCGEEIKKDATKCRYCHEFLEDEKLQKNSNMGRTNTKLDEKHRGKIQNSKKHKKIYRHSLDKSIIECNVCWYEWEWWRKTQWWLIDLLNYFFLWTLLLVILDTFKKELVICPECWTSNVIEVECEKVWFFTKLLWLLLGVGIIIWIICLIWYLCS